MYASPIETLAHDNPAVLMKADYSDYIVLRKSFFYPNLFFTFYDFPVSLSSLLF